MKVIDKRKLRVIFNKGGGTASKTSYSPKITLPKSWMDEMGVTLEEREVELTFDGKKIVIKKKIDI